VKYATSTPHGLIFREDSQRAQKVIELLILPRVTFEFLGKIVKSGYIRGRPRVTFEFLGKIVKSGYIRGRLWQSVTASRRRNA
jgi:hypothetical protein